MRRTRLVLYREVFLAYVLSNQPITIIQGLHRRFPVTWNNRNQYPFYKHMFFQKPLIQDEYRLNFAYCLFESANQNEDVFGVLFNELYKKESKLYRELKSKYAGNKRIGIKQLELLINERKLENSPFEEICFVSIIDFFIEYLKIEYDESQDLLKWTGLLETRQNQCLGIDPTEYPMSFNEIRRGRSKSHDEWSKNLKRLYRIYSEYLGQNAIDYVNNQILSQFENSLPKDDQFPLAWCQQLGIISLEESFQLTVTELLDVFSLVLFTKVDHNDQKLNQQETLIRLGEFEIPESELMLFNELLPQAAIYYKIFKNQRVNHEFFLASYVMVDGTSVKSLQQQIEKLKKELKQTKEMNKVYKIQLNKSKLQTEKEVHERSQLLAALNLNLSRENEGLIKQLSNVEMEYQKLIEQYETLKIESSITSIMKHKERVYELNISDLNTPEIMIVGGATATIQRLKQMLPDCKYFEVDKKYNDQFFKGVKSAILLTNILNHGMTRKLEKHCPNILKKSVTATNINRIMKEIAEFHLKT